MLRSCSLGPCNQAAAWAASTVASTRLVVATQPQVARVPGAWEQYPPLRAPPTLKNHLNPPFNNVTALNSETSPMRQSCTHNENGNKHQVFIIMTGLLSQPNPAEASEPSATGCPVLCAAPESPGLSTSRSSGCPSGSIPELSSGTPAATLPQMMGWTLQADPGGARFPVADSP